MVPHPDTDYFVTEMERRQLLVEVARARLAAAARAVGGPRPSSATAARRRLGAVLVGVGTNLGGADGVAAVAARPKHAG